MNARDAVLLEGLQAITDDGKAAQLEALQPWALQSDIIFQMERAGYSCLNARRRVGTLLLLLGIRKDDRGRKWSVADLRQAGATGRIEALAQQLAEDSEDSQESIVV